jgi:negative regulator of sigma-B (phosphoserine phosphatase)
VSNNNDQLDDVLEWSAASSALPGQATSGDMYLVKAFADGALAAVVDGLGHGEEALVASRRAIDLLSAHAAESVITQVNRCHEALRSTRGVAMTVVSFNFIESVVTVLGIGNVETVLVRGNGSAVPPSETMLLRAGVVGYQLPALRASVLPIHRGDLMLFCTDGIDASFTDRLSAADPPKRLANRILEEHYKGNDDAMVLAVKFHGTSHA